MRFPRGSIAIVSVLVGCLSRPASETAPLDAGALPDAGPPSILSFFVRTESGETRELDAAPRRPVVVLEASAPLDPETDAIALFSGSADDAFLDDLARPPLRVSNEARRVAIEVTARGAVIEARPVAPLEVGMPYVIAVGGWATDALGNVIAAPFSGSLRVASGPRAGAALAGAWPADGTFGVPPRLPLIALRFDGEVRGIEDTALATAVGAAVPARVEHVLCEEIGWRDGQCVAIRPDRVLDEGTMHEVIVGDGVRDATGASVGPARIAFQTHDAIAAEPAFAAAGCALDEAELEIGCALVDDRSITLRLAADAPVRLWLFTSSASSSAVAPRGEAAMRLDGLWSGTPYDVILRAIDLAGREQTFSVEITTEADLPLLSITEVRADPRGAEPAQEYVEVTNAGDAPIDLAGFALSDRADREGDLIARAVVLPPRGRALVVADAFDPLDLEDDPAPAGVPLVRIGSSLGSGGLTNAGEPLFLRDGSGRRVSSAPALAAPAEGACIVRISGDPRRGGLDAFAPDAELGCTPGKADRLP